MRRERQLAGQPFLSQATNMESLSDQLSIQGVELALGHHGLKYEPSGTGQFCFWKGSDIYYLYCANLPKLFIEYSLGSSLFLRTEKISGALISAINSVNEKYHLVKVSLDDFGINFMLCLREESYTAFEKNLPVYIRELDDVVESFRMVIDMMNREADRAPMEAFLGHILDENDDMYKIKRTHS